MARAVTLREHVALAALTRQLDEIKEQFDAERLSQRRDAAEREAQRLGREPFVISSYGVPGAPPLPRLRRRWG